MQDSFKVLSSACRVLWKYCIAFKLHFIALYTHWNRNVAVNGSVCCSQERVLGCSVKLSFHPSTSKYQTRVKTNFRIPNYIFAKAATPLNLYLERAMFTSKSTANFAIQNPFKVRSTGTNFSHILLWKIYVWRNRRKLQMKTWLFPSTLHTKLNSLKEHSTLQG